MWRRRELGPAELATLHERVRVVFALMFVLTSCIIAYIAVRVYVLTSAISLVEFASLCCFAFACAVLSTAQLQCLRHVRHETQEGVEAAFTDTVTGVYNHRYLEMRLKEEVRRATRGKSPLAAIYFDFDRFKILNAFLGREVGDAVLREALQAARQTCRTDDVVARVGDDEFVMVLPQTDTSGALAAASRLKDKLQALGFTRGYPDDIDLLTLSFGVASYPADARTEDDLIRAADEAMDRAKEAGGDRVST